MAIFQVFLAMITARPLWGRTYRRITDQQTKVLESARTIDAFILFYRTLFGVFQSIQGDNVCIDMLLVFCEHLLGAMRMQLMAFLIWGWVLDNLIGVEKYVVGSSSFTDSVC